MLKESFRLLSIIFSLVMMQASYSQGDFGMFAHFIKLIIAGKYEQRFYIYFGK